MKHHLIRVVKDNKDRDVFIHSHRNCFEIEAKIYLKAGKKESELIMRGNDKGGIMIHKNLRKNDRRGEKRDGRERKYVGGVEKSPVSFPSPRPADTFMFRQARGNRRRQEPIDTSAGLN